MQGGQRPAHGEPAGVGSGDRTLILNVNDNDASRYLVTRMLQRAGLEVIEAATGAAALERVRNDKPALVVLDIKLPDIDGLEICRRIKGDPQTNAIKVLHTSAVFVASEFKVQSLECGADGYLSHPFEQEELIATVRSLLRLIEAEQSLRDHAGELKAANRRTNEFLAMLAHELRNPLAAIVTSLPLLDRRAPVDSVEKTARELIRRQTSNLRRLVDDLLDAARVTQGKIDLHWEVINLNDLIRRVAANAQQSKMQPRSQALRLALTSARMVVRGDPMRLEQALTNLLDNASKYSDSGAVIEFSVTLERSASGSSEARLVVRDRGVGMAAETLPTIFNLFSQADVPLARSRGGLGIGLTLSRTLIELHGGSVRASSEGLGKGSEFQIALPLLADDARVAVPVAVAQPIVEPHSSRRVLIVEDNRDAQEALACLLKLWGHDVVLANDGDVGIQCALDARPEIALVDLGLPTVDGYEVARQVRATLGNASPLLIALTGYGAPEQRAAALAAGFDLHIVKPVDPDRLAALLEEYSARAPAGSEPATTHSGRDLPWNDTHTDH
ncbi:MAG: response regulator [Gammaproteobacteria bacterium]